MSAGQFKKGAPSPNPAGRPSKFESALRQIKLPLEAMGVTEQEIWALATAFSEDSDFAISIVTTHDLPAARSQARKSRVGGIGVQP